MATTRIDTVVIGGGQAGLSVSYYLSRQGREHVVLEQADAPADAWRNHRWEFVHAQHAQLAIPASGRGTR